MSSGATQVTAQKSRTLKLGIQQAALTAPQQHLSTAERPLKDYIVQAIYGRTDQNDLVLAPRLGEVALVLKAKRNIKRSTTPHVATESKRGPCNMITAKIWKPKTGLRPASHRRASAALDLALTAALRRAGNFDVAEAEAWKGVPDAVKETFTVDIKHVEEEAIKTIAERLSRHSGVTIKMQGKLGRAELAVDIDIYAHEYVPALAGILHEPAEMLAEPRGRVNERPITSFHQLLDEEYEAMKTLAVELFAELHMAESRQAQE